MMHKEEFLLRLFAKITSSIDNNFTDNHDHIRHGVNNTKFSIKGKIADFVRKKLILTNEVKGLPEIINRYNPSIYALLSNFYAKLEDDSSRDLMVDIIAYRLMTYRKVRLPLSTPQYWSRLKEIEEQVGELIETNSHSSNFNLYRYDLNQILDSNLKINMFPKAILTTFDLEQYAYKSNDLKICAKDGDYVIDAGGCWGDTALYFAEKVGTEGKVFTFEFIPSNIKILKENISLNGETGDRVKLVFNPIWDESGKDVYYADYGPGSKVAFEPIEGIETEPLKTISIDDFVENNNVSKLDFIKMDIEGAEPFALKGGEKSIRKFKPTLAIAIYHGINDFVNIPDWVLSLDMGYHIFLGHYTIHKDESVLFAVHSSKLDQFKL